MRYANSISLSQKKKKKKSQVPKIKRVSQNILRISPETTTASTTAF